MKIILGTAQFGLDYGITNKHGQVSNEEMVSMLQYARDCGIEFLDTAAAYGNSEQRISELGFSKYFKLITKIPSMQQTRDVPGFIEQSLATSLKHLNVNSFDTLMLHDERDLNQITFNKLEQLKAEGYFSRIGCSFYSEVAALKAIDETELDVIQIPGSVVDLRFKEAGVVSKSKGKGIEVHNRSLFLQGLLLTERDARPQQFKDNPSLLELDHIVTGGNISRLMVSLSPLTDEWFSDKFVLGFTSKAEMIQVVSSLGDLTGDSFAMLKSTDNEFLDPRLWK